MSVEPYPKFPKIPRYVREWQVTEKIDGTNGQIFIKPLTEDEILGVTDSPSLPPCVAFVGLGADSPWEYGYVAVAAGSRNRWLTPESDNHGFAAWVQANAKELAEVLPAGRHYGEWWGKGIQRGYDMPHKVFTLFDGVERYGYEINFGDLPVTMPFVLHWSYGGPPDSLDLFRYGYSHAADSFGVSYDHPEGVVVRHMPSGHLYKFTYEGDHHKGQE